MKVLYYIHSLVIGGAEKIVTDYILELQKRDIEVCLVVNSLSGSFLERKIKENNVKIYVLFSDYKSKLARKIEVVVNKVFFSYYSKWKKIILEEKPDIIHVHTCLDFFGKPDFPKEKIFYTFHSDIGRSLSLASKKNRRLLEYYSNKGMTFCAVSEKAKKEIKKMYNTNRILVIPNSMNYDEILLNRMSKKTLCEEIDVPEDSFLVCHIGRLNPVKNHERLLEIFAELKKSNPNSSLILIGGDENGRKRQLEEYADRLNIKSNVYFLGIREDATKLLSGADVFVLPSFAESFSLVTVEAQILNVHSVVSDVLPEEVMINKNCTRISLNCSNLEWVKEIEKHIESDDCLIEKKFDIEYVINDLIEHYSRISK